MKSETLTRSEAETEELGRALAGRLTGREIVYLVGELGAGKTAFARGLARGLGARPREVASPTFAILHEYARDDGRIALRHLDLYRLRDRAAELDVLGLPESVADAPVVVEWPGDAIRAVLPPEIEVRFEMQPDGSRRIRVDQP